MKFLHTADWQIGMKADSVGDCGKRVREERLAAGARVIEVAKSENVDFILVAGDIFEDNGVDRSLVQKTADIFRSFSKPVLIIPGNHDPLVPGSVWEHPSWNSSPNVRVIREAAPIPILDAVIYPCPLKAKRSTSNPTSWIAKETESRIRIGLAHGTVEGARQDEPDYPIPRDTPERAGLDYLALGHWHSYAEYKGADGQVRMTYSGTHETTKFGERDSGNVLVVEIESHEKAPEIKPVRTGGLEWLTFSEELISSGDLSRVKDKIESIKDPRATLIQLKLAGILNMEEQPELDHLEEILNTRFLWNSLDTSNLRASPTDRSWIDDLGPGIIREAALRLLQNSENDPGITQLALARLYSIVQGASK
ncbi:MAG: metallophosphoesterase family protein [Desulfomonilaceae bacterium]